MGCSDASPIPGGEGTEAGVHRHTNRYPGPRNTVFDPQISILHIEEPGGRGERIVSPAGFQLSGGIWVGKDGKRKVLDEWEQLGKCQR